MSLDKIGSMVLGVVANRSDALVKMWCDIVNCLDADKPLSDAVGRTNAMLIYSMDRTRRVVQ